MELNKIIHLLENAIHNDIFSTLHNHNYNLTNSNPKVLIDTLIEVLIKATTGSVQSIEQELFAINTESFNNLRHYLNRTTYLKERLGNTNTEISDKLIQIILLGRIQKSHIQLYFNLTYGGNKPDYVTIFKTLQSFANDKTQLSLARIDAKSASKNNSDNNSNSSSGDRGSNRGGSNSGSDDKKYKKYGKKHYPDRK